MAGPLDGIRVLDLSQWQQGPYATVLLSDLGAQVVKVERPGYGDAGRHALGGFNYDEIAPDFFAHNRGKRGITVNLSSPEGREVILTLAEQTDVVVHNFRMGVMDRWGLDYETFKARNPQIIYAKASGSGPDGPYKERPMFDIVAQAMGGIMSVNGFEGQPPTPVGTFMADQVGAIMLALSISAALVARERQGVGQSIDVSLLGSQVALQSFEITHHLFTGTLPRRAGRGHPHSDSLWFTYPAKDGHFVMAGVSDDPWPEFCRLLGDPGLVDEPEFNCFESRARNREALMARLDALLRKQTVAHWVEVLGEIGIACGPVQTYDQVVSDPQILANDYITEMDHPQLGRIKVVNTPFRFSATPLQLQGPEPELGQHTEEVLLEHGFDWDQIIALKDAGAI